MKKISRNYVILQSYGWQVNMFQRVFKNSLHRFEKLSAPMEAFATVKPQFFNGDSLESSDTNVELHYVWKIKEEHGRFNKAITTVADAALIGLRWMPWSP